MKKNTLIALAVVVVLLLLSYWWFYKKPAGDYQAPTSGEEQELQGETGVGGTGGGTGGTGEQAEENVVTYTDSGFSPSTLTVEAGDTVVFRNETATPFWPASAVHPTHLLYPEFDAKAAISGNYSFTFNRVGTWKYHNHLNTSQTGTIVVE